MSTYDEKREAEYWEVLQDVRRRAGVYIAEPALTRLLDFTFGYEFAVYRLTGYQLSFYKKFCEFLYQKYQITEFPRSLCAFLKQGKSEEYGFDAFWHEVDDFHRTTGYPQAARE